VCNDLGKKAMAMGVPKSNTMLLGNDYILLPMSELEGVQVEKGNEDKGKVIL
jgi:hypothetical protein